LAKDPSRDDIDTPLTGMVVDLRESHADAVAVMRALSTMVGTPHAPAKIFVVRSDATGPLVEEVTKPVTGTPYEQSEQWLTAHQAGSPGRAITQPMRTGPIAPVEPAGSLERSAGQPAGVRRLLGSVPPTGSASPSGGKM
jgi:hypothetical protein